MSTNYYKVFIPTEAQLDALQRGVSDLRSIKKGVLDRDPDIIKDEMKSILDQNSPVHICKMSCGWKTNFDHHWGGYYNLTKKSIDEFLRRSDGYLVDEYGQRIDVDEFWNDVETRDAIPGAMTTKEFMEKTGELDGTPRQDKTKFEITFGINTTQYGDYVTSEGLRFSISPDFR